MERRTRLTWTLGLTAAALLQAARALEGSLARLHRPLGGAAPYADLVDPGKVDAAWAIWSEGQRALAGFHPLGPTPIVVWHVVAETFAVLCLLTALAAVLKLPSGCGLAGRLRALGRRSWGLLALLAGGLVVLGNLGEAWIVGTSCCRATIARPVGWLLVVERIVTGLALIALVVTKRNALKSAWGYVLRSPAVLRVLLGLDAGLVAILYAGAIGSQTEDVVERWLEGDWPHALAALAGYLAFVAVVWSGRRLWPSRTRTAPAKLLVIGAVVTASGAVVWSSDFAGRGAGLLVLGVMVLLVAIGEWVVPARPAVLIHVPAPLLRGAVAAIPALAIGLLLVRTGVNHAVVGDDAAWLAILGAASLALGAGAWHFCSREADSAWPRWPYVLQAVLVTAAMVAVSWAFRDRSGSFAVLLFTLAEVAAVALAVRAGFRSNVPPRVFRVLGFRRTPVVTAIVVWISVASAVNGASNAKKTGDRVTHYDARIAGAKQPLIGGLATPVDVGCVDRTSTEPATSEVRSAFCRWVASQAAYSRGRAEIPMVLVTASGGGVRAAAWTEKVLDCLFLRDDAATCSGATPGRDRWPLLFAANGASGGSVGIASTVAERLSHVGAVPTGARSWWREQQDDDTLAPLLGHAVLNDSLLGMFGVFVGEDRATTLEDAWARRWRGDSAEYCGGGLGEAPSPVDLGFVDLRRRCGRTVPLLLFNGTDVNTGRRVNLAPADLDDSNPEDRFRPHDLVDYLDRDELGELDQDLPLFTAAFLSARFPLVTPSGRLPSCRVPGDPARRACPDRIRASGQVLNVVDGGYAENSGTGQVAELWIQLLPLIQAYNGGTSGAPPAATPVRAVLVEIENGERPAEEPPPHASTAGEIFRPLAAILNVTAGSRSGTRDALIAGFQGCAEGRPPASGPMHVRFSMYEHPGRTLPLGWTLAKHSLDSLDTQFELRANKHAAECFAAAVPGPVVVRALAAVPAR